MTALTARERWLARAALLAAAAAVVVLLLFAGLRAIALLGVGAGGLVVTAAGLWWALTHRGARRALALALAVAAPVLVLIAYVNRHVAWVIALSAALWLAAVVAGRSALVRVDRPAAMPETPAAPPRQPFMIMNPRSGGGKVARFGLREKAEALGADVALLEGPGTVDVAGLAQAAVVKGADVLGVAGGDGTQAIVADVAAEHGVPLLVIPAGTRNHFALDLGLDRDDPAKALDALRDGTEMRVDLGRAGGRPFVNNVSFGAYAEVVQSPSYRGGKTRTVADVLPDYLMGHRGARLTARTGDVVVSGPQAVLVSNNPYGMGDITGLGRRPYLNGGVLGMIGVRVSSAAQAAGLLRGQRSAGLTRATGRTVTVDADRDRIPVGVDGEALTLPVPVHCEVRPSALRVLVPRQRPGVPGPRPHIAWKRIFRLALVPDRPAAERAARR
ncbi:diacylglycerol/lipid kinase family protein [Streptomyces rimosus]|uniref:diacylglycerol/lipid kinase family protein n=1 Tax=Streptomyces rimosus TaxID=1927 RepID=UPI0004C15148|nr:diacylglycerol kinase family protein [Streptomyces rimosus]